MQRIAIALLLAFSLQSSPPTRAGNGFILGRTVDAGTGRPVAGAIVRLNLPATNVQSGGSAGRGGPSAPIPGQQSVVTNAEGYFLFRDLPAGRFSMTATALGYMQSGYLQSKPAGAARSLELAGTKVAPTTEEMPHFNIATVSALTGGSQREAMAIVEPDGRFATNGDLPGPYFVMALAPSGWYLRSVTHQGRNIADEPIDLSSDVNDVVATFVDVTSKLSGTVVNANGGADAQADVIVFPADSDGWRHGASNSMRLRLAAASETGGYTFATLPTGQYYVVAVSDSVVGEWRDPKFLQQLVGGATKVTLGDGEDKTVALKTVTIR